MAASDITPGLRSYIEHLVPSCMPGLRIASIERAPTGARARVYLVKDDSRRGLAVKIHKKATLALASRRALRHMSTFGLSVPKHLRIDPVARLRPAVAGWVTVEELVEGEAFPSASPSEEDCRLAGEALGRLHSVRREQWGGLVLARGFSGCIEKELARAKAHLKDMTAEDAPLVESLGARLGELAESVPARRDWSLLHGRVNGGNVLVGGGSACLVDVGNAHYGHFGRDLARALERLCGPVENAQGWLLDSYFAAVEGVEAPEWQASRGFFETSLAVQQYRHWSRLAARETDAPRREALIEKARQWHGRLAEGDISE